MKTTYKILLGLAEEKSPLGESLHRWENNIEVDLDWTELISLRITDKFFGMSKSRGNLTS
jgi:hypothetical protein